MKYVEECDLAILFPQANPECVNEFKKPGVKEYVTNIELFHGFGTSVIWINSLDIDGTT